MALLKTFSGRAKVTAKSPFNRKQRALVEFEPRTEPEFMSTRDLTLRLPVHPIPNYTYTCICHFDLNRIHAIYTYMGYGVRCCLSVPKKAFMLFPGRKRMCTAWLLLSEELRE